jgi:predicted HicB family RNase H-like nuclease
MSQKKRPVERPKKVNATAEKLRAVRLEVPEDVHEQLRIEAARQDTSLAALARVAVEEYLKRKGGGK